MRTVIVGAGAIGTLLGAYMVRGGNEVTMVDLPDVVKKLHNQDFEIRTFRGDSFKVQLKSTSDPDSLGEVDLLIISVKTFNTLEAVSSVAHLRDRITAVLSIQNGVDKELILSECFGKEKLIGGCCLEGASRIDDHCIMHTMSMGTYIGEVDGGISPRVRSVVKLFTDGGLNANVSEQVVSADWCKWINFAAGAAVCGLTRLPYYKVLLNSETAELMAEIYREYAALAGSCGVQVADFPGFEVKTIAGVSVDEAVALFRRRGEALMEKGATKVMPSLAQDIVAGRKTECESIFGFAVNEGKQRGIPMGFTRYVYKLILAIDQNRLKGTLVP